MLEGIARKYTSPYYHVVRAKVILLAAQGLDNDQIGSHVSLPRQIVSKWRKRFFEERLAGLENLSLAIAARTWFGRSPSAALWPRLAAGPFGGGLMRTRFGPGNIAVGYFRAIPTSKRRPSECWISIRVSGMESPWGRTTT